MSPETKLSALLLFSLFLGGCVSTSDYPESWATGYPQHDLVFDKPGGKCDLTGSYADAGEPPQGQDSAATISLFSTFFPHQAFPSSNMPDQVTVRELDAKTLLVSAQKDGKLLETRELKNFVCLENGLVMVNPGAENISGYCPATVCAGNQDNFLYRGSDGWLVLKRIDLAVVLPGFKWETRWYRFRPAIPAEGAK